MFKKAKPIFLKNLQNEMNISALFKAEFNSSSAPIKLIITGATYYKVLINGSFVCFGPARAGLGYTRVDEIDVTAFVKEGKNQIIAEVASYRCDSLNNINMPGFLQAELICGADVVAATGYDFSGFLNTEKEQKVMRYSYQRHFSEVYISGREPAPAELEITNPELLYIPREVPFPNCDFKEPEAIAYTGTFVKNPLKEYPYQRYIDTISSDCTKGSHGYLTGDMEYKPLYDTMDLKFMANGKNLAVNLPTHIKSGEYMVFDMGRNTTGFINHDVMVATDTCRMIIGFNERDKNGDFFPMENDLTNVVDYHLQKGESKRETFEVHGFRYLFVIVLSGELTLNSVNVREYKFNLPSYPKVKTDNKKLEEIYEAAVETFCQNTIDVFSDCPTRERAGWFMDSFLTARSEYFLTGKTTISRIMLDNIAMAKSFPGLPKGIMPMCYPADTLCVFIPQWCMWYGLQVYEHTLREGTNAEKYKRVLYELCGWLKSHENSDGLLQKLEGWNFVEWSKCNDDGWIQDVNYPTNMLYYVFLIRLYEMYGDCSLLEKAERIKNKVIEKSFNGKYFVENAIYNENGVLENTGNISETCQYYAIWSGVADLEKEEFASLKNTVLTVFGPFGTHDFPEYEPSNALNGMYLRMDILLRLKENKLLEKEIVDFFYGMVEKTGTLWEHKTESNSMNHGFASWVAEVISKIS